MKYIMLSKTIIILLKLMPTFIAKSMFPLTWTQAIIRTVPRSLMHNNWESHSLFSPCHFLRNQLEAFYLTGASQV